MDRFLGDADNADCSLPSPFGNRRAKPYWTGWSFDTCALIAVAYPIAGVIMSWIGTGNGGELGDALGLRTGAPDRTITVALIVWTAFAFWNFGRSSGWRTIVWLLAGAGAIVGAGAFGVAVTVIGVSAIALVASNADACSGAYALVGALTAVGAFAVFPTSVAGSLVVGMAGAAAVGAITVLSASADQQQQMGQLLVRAGGRT